eukprot:Hpha_TRINITY_DN30472_c0_g1::TRINITY_DN30472_c0_g1_i1::g.168048::m.168048
MGESIDAAVMALRGLAGLEQQGAAEVCARAAGLRKVAFLAAEKGSQPECQRIAPELEDYVSRLLTAAPTRLEARAASAALSAVWAWLDDSALRSGYQRLVGLLKEQHGVKAKAVIACICDALSTIFDGMLERGLRATQLATAAASDFVTNTPNLEKFPDSLATREAIAAALVPALQMASEPPSAPAGAVDEQRALRQVVRACRDPSPCVRYLGYVSAGALAPCCDACGEQGWVSEQLVQVCVRGFEDVSPKCRAAASEAAAEVLWTAWAQSLRVTAAGGGGGPGSGEGGRWGISLSRVSEALGVRRKRRLADLYDGVTPLREAFRAAQGKEDVQTAAALATARLLALSHARGTPCTPPSGDDGDDGGEIRSPPGARMSLAILCSLHDGEGAPTAAHPSLWGGEMEGQVAAAAGVVTPSPQLRTGAVPPGVRAVAKGIASWAALCSSSQQRRVLTRELAGAAALRSTPNPGVPPPSGPVAAACVEGLAMILHRGLGEEGDAAEVVDALVTAGSGAGSEWQLDYCGVGWAFANALKVCSPSVRRAAVERLGALLTEDLAGNAWLGPGTACDEQALVRTAGAAQLLCAAVGAVVAASEPFPSKVRASLEVLCWQVVGTPRPLAAFTKSSLKDTPWTPPGDSLRARASCVLHATVAAISADPEALTRLADALGCLIRPPGLTGEGEDVGALLGAVVGCELGLQAVVFALRCGARTGAVSTSGAAKVLSAIDGSIENLLWSPSLPTSDETLDSVLSRARAACCEAAALLAQLRPETKGGPSTWQDMTRACVASIAASGWSPAVVASGDPGEAPFSWHHLAPPSSSASSSFSLDASSPSSYFTDAAIAAIGLLFGERSVANQIGITERLLAVIEAHTGRQSLQDVTLERNVVAAVAACLGYDGADVLQEGPFESEKVLQRALSVAELSLKSKCSKTRDLGAELFGLVAARCPPSDMLADQRLQGMVAAAGRQGVGVAAAASCVGAVWRLDPLRREDALPVALVLLEVLAGRIDDDGTGAVAIAKAVAAVARSASPSKSQARRLAII